MRGCGHRVHGVRSVGSARCKSNGSVFPDRAPVPPQVAFCGSIFCVYLPKLRDNVVIPTFVLDEVERGPHMQDRAGVPWDFVAWHP